MKQLTVFLLAGCILLNSAASASDGIPGIGTAVSYLEAQMRGGVLKGASVGLCILDTEGNALQERQARTRMVPASNLKLITTGAALHALGPDYRFETRLGYNGTVSPDGTLEGDLYILGGGDPSLGSKDTTALKSATLFGIWKSLLAGAGIYRINGRIIGDGRVWEGHLENDSWSWNDTGTYYGAGSNALSFYKNTVDMLVSASTPGASVNLRQVYPQTPWMHIGNYGFTGPEGTGNKVYMFASDLAPYAELRGSFASDRRPEALRFANKYGDLTCAYYFWSYLYAAGYGVGGGYAFVDRNGRVTGPDFVPSEPAASLSDGSMMLLGGTESPTLAQLTHTINYNSDNFYAESLFRALGEIATDVAVYDSSRVAIAEILRDLNLDADAYWQEDGSGLSRQNQLSPGFLASFLLQMTGSDSFPEFLASLPRPGEGTLAPLRMKNADRIRLKSGSMRGTICFSGYILDAGGRPEYVLSFMINNSLATSDELRYAAQRFLRLMME